MEFKKYCSIENSYRDISRRHGLEQFGQETFLIQEKYHGANAQLIITKDTIKMAKRTAFLSPGEKFYNWEEVLSKYEVACRELFNKIKELGMFVEEISICGELVGGSYPHPDVAKNNTAAKIQKGIFYTPNNEFIAFDLKIDGHYIPLTEFYLLMGYINKIPVAPIKFTGNLAQCLEYPNEFQSEAYQLFNLPIIQNNVCEGTVIKALNKSLYFGNGQRVIYKNKNEKWTEKSQKKKHKTTDKQPLSAEALKLRENMVLLVNENRLRNVLSKMSGEITFKRFGEFMKLLSIDVREEFDKDYSHDLDELSLTEKKRVTKACSEAISSLLRKNMQNMIDGEF